MGKPQILRINDVLVPDFAALATSSSRHSGPLHKVRLSSLRIARSRSPPARWVGAEAVQRAAGASAFVRGGGRGGGRPLRAPGNAGRAGEGGKPAPGPRAPCAHRPSHVRCFTEPRPSGPHTSLARQPGHQPAAGVCWVPSSQHSELPRGGGQRGTGRGQET